VTKERKRDDTLGVQGTIQTGQNLSDRLSAHKMNQEQLPPSREIYSHNSSMDIENIPASTSWLKENYSTSYQVLGNQKNSEICLSNSTKVDDEEGPSRVGHNHSSMHSEGQRTIFQLNNEAANVSTKTIQDFSLNYLKKEEKTGTELFAPRLEPKPMKDIENEGSMIHQTLNPQAAAIQDSLSQNFKESLVENKQPSSSLSTELRSSQSDSDTPTGPVLGDQFSIQPKPLEFPAKVHDEEERPPNEESRLSNAIIAPTNMEGPLTELQPVEAHLTCGEKTTQNEGSRHDLNSQLHEPIILCLVEGEDKENVSPIILEDFCDKTAAVGAEHMDIEHPVRRPDNLLMDQDKEPVFAEENLQADINFILDEESLSRLGRSADENCIIEVEKYLVGEDQIQDTQIPDTALQNLGVSCDNQQESQPDLMQIMLSQAPELHVSEPVDKDASERKDKPLPCIKILSSKKSLPNTDSAQRPSSRQNLSNNNKPSMNLVKRAPLVVSTSANKVATPSRLIQDRKENKLKMLSAMKEARSPLSQRPESKLIARDRSLSSRSVTQSNAKTNNRVPVAKNLDITPKKKDQLNSETKLCPETVAKMSVAKQILLQKKPPVPKFSFNPKTPVKKIQEGELSPLPRKPPVPRLSELLKKK
jgi:hypothetical protein